MTEKYIRFEIPSHEDRRNLVIALANAGYKVWVTDTAQLITHRYFVNVVTDVVNDLKEQERVEK